MFESRFLLLTKQLYPRGRAWKLFNNSWFERLHKGLAVSESRAYGDAVAILNSILPDNDNFTAEDATDWERRLGLINNPLVDLADRKLAIIRKMNHPGTIKARQHYLYIQGQLQAAGFDVYVYENFGELLPADFIVIPEIASLDEANLDEFNLGDTTTVYPELFGFANLDEFNLGEFNLDEEVYLNKIVNNIPTEADSFFDIGQTSRATFFIGGFPQGTFANVPLIRRDEFRKLILTLKPVQNVGYLLINYT
jgi:hypothetical protein